MRSLSSLLLLALVVLIALAELPCSVLAGRDFYKILGVARNANDRAIKKAYRQMAKLHHPDRPLEEGQTKEEANARFQDIGAAYETLSDPEKRRVYDQAGEEGLKQQAGQQGGARDPFDIFGQMFGGGMRHGHGHGGDPSERRGEDIQLDLPVTLEDLYVGKVYEVKLHQQHLCSQCHGSGARHESDVQQCPHCQGRGSIIKMHQIGPGFMQQVQQPCGHCAGKGKIIKHKCPKCGGAKVGKGTRKLDVLLEAGMSDGARIEFEHMADESPEHAAGHVVFTVRTAPHSRFERRGNDLHTVQRITLREALVGFERTLRHLDGHEVPLRVAAGRVTSHGEVARIAKEGMPHHNAQSQRGDLYVKYEVEFPKELTQEQKAGLAAILQ